MNVQHFRIQKMIQFNVFNKERADFLLYQTNLDALLITAK